MYNITNSITLGSFTITCRGPHLGFTVNTPQEEFVLSTQQVFELLRFINEDHRACLVQATAIPGPGSHWEIRHHEARDNFPTLSEQKGEGGC